MKTIRSLMAVLFAASPLVSQDPAAAAPQPDAAFFDPDVVQDIQLTVVAADLKRLHAALPRRIYVPATFQWGDILLERVGLRYKGDSSSRPDSRHKRGLLIKFAEFVEKQRFLGLRRVALDNGIQFGGMFSERLITDILRDVGVPASRCNYARVRLNGKFLGVYVNVERVDQAFLQRHFPGVKGVLYKNHAGGPGADLRDVGDAAAYARTFEVKAGRKRARPEDLVTFIKNVDGRGRAGYDFGKGFHVDRFVWQMGVLLLAGAFDQYTGWGPHNYYLFHDSKSGRWHYLTWDLDVGFADRAFGRIPVIDGWNAAWPTPNPGRPLLERVAGDPELLRLYRERTKELLKTHFDPTQLGAKLDRLYGQIKDDLEREPYRQGRVTNRADRSHADVVAAMKRFMVARSTLATAQLENPGARPAPTAATRGRRRGPVPGAASGDAPSELVVVRSSLVGVELKWRDNATDERAVIVQRATGEKDAPFRNLMPVHGQDPTRAIDRRVQPGRIYRYRVYAVKPSRRGPVGTGVSNVVTVRIPDR